VLPKGCWVIISTIETLRIFYDDVNLIKYSKNSVTDLLIYNATFASDKLVKLPHMNTDHEHHQHHHHGSHQLQKTAHEGGTFRLALSATLHCLLGCGLGEILGMIISVWLGLSMINSMIVAITMGFVLGLGFGMIPLLKRKFTFRDALKIVIIAEGLSILVMEAVEVYVQVKIPGVMEAGLTDPIFWTGMFAGLTAGFIAAFPVNYIMVKKGVRHVH
jgi:hypothetical protein